MSCDFTENRRERLIYSPYLKAVGMSEISSKNPSTELEDKVEYWPCTYFANKAFQSSLGKA